MNYEYDFTASRIFTCLEIFKSVLTIKVNTFLSIQKLVIRKQSDDICNSSLHPLLSFSLNTEIQNQDLESTSLFSKLKMNWEILNESLSRFHGERRKECMYSLIMLGLKSYVEKDNHYMTNLEGIDLNNLRSYSRKR